MSNVYYVGSGELTFDLIERIINENLKLELAPEAKLRIQKCRDYLDHKIASSEEPLYGITTGFGSLCTKNISSGELGTLQENLIKSHDIPSVIHMLHTEMIITRFSFLCVASPTFACCNILWKEIAEISKVLFKKL